MTCPDLDLLSICPFFCGGIIKLQAHFLIEGVVKQDFAHTCFQFFLKILYAFQYGYKRSIIFRIIQVRMCLFISIGVLDLPQVDHGGGRAQGERRSLEWSTSVACRNLNRIKNFGGNNFGIKRVCTHI
jgi:hypothetical protein